MSQVNYKKGINSSNKTKLNKLQEQQKQQAEQKQQENKEARQTTISTTNPSPLQLFSIGNCGLSLKATCSQSLPNPKLKVILSMNK
jgi:hypothetical protein